MKLFIDQANTEFEKIVSQFPEPRSIAFPNYLTNFIFQLIQPEIMNRYIQKKVTLDKIGRSDNKMTLFYITAGDPKSLNNVCVTFKNVPNYTKVILVIPRYTLVCQQILANHGFIASHGGIPTDPQSEVGVYDFHADFLPIEDDFFLMPCFRSFLQLNVDHDYSEVFNSGRALAKLQTVFGRIPHIFTIGSNAERVKHVMDEMNDKANTLRTATPQIDTLIIIDRIADMATPMMTQTNVEGLIDNIFGINFGLCVPPNGVISESSLKMTDQNEIFRTTRMLSLDKATDNIKAIVNEIQASIDALNEDSSIKAKNEALLRANKMRLLKEKFENQTNLIDAVMQKTIEAFPAFNSIISKEYCMVKDGESSLDLCENLVTMWNDWTTALRLLCLQSISGQTHSKKTVSYIQKEACSEFGLETQPMLIAFDHLRFISPNPFPLKWSSIVKELDIFPVGEDPAKEPLQGFVPPSVRIVQAAVNGQWENVQRAYDDKVISMSVTGQAPEHIEGEKRRVLVFYVGGITLSEAGILRNLSKMSQNIEIIIGATEKVNGNQIIHDIFPATMKTN